MIKSMAFNFLLLHKAIRILTKTNRLRNFGFLALFGPFLALNLSTYSSIFLCLANVTQEHYMLTTNFWMTAYAALPSLSSDGRQQTKISHSLASIK